MAKDKDPILDEKFFSLLYPKIHTFVVSDEILKHVYEEDMVKHRLHTGGKLLESAISVQKGLERHDTEGRDFVDGSDAKASSVRWSSNNTNYSAPICEIFNKRGLLRCVIYERQHDKWYYFLIPRSAYAHIPKTSNIEIPFNLNGTPKRDSKRIRYVNWWTFEVANFEGILGDTPAEFEFIKDKRIRLASEKLQIQVLNREEKRIAQLEKLQEKLLRKLNKPVRAKRSRVSTKSHPNS